MATPTLHDVQDAAATIADHIIRTPLLKAHGLSHDPVWLKCENFQITRSFKPRGAFNALLRLDPETRQRGVVARSSGNFAQAVAYAAKTLGIPATIVMPSHAPAVKVERTRAWGATVIQHGTTHPEGQAKAEALAAAQNAVLLHPYDHNDVIAGQGTLALEVLADLPGCQTFIAPVGGGGLLAGCALALKSLRPNIRVIAAEPENADDFARSFAAQERQSIPQPQSIADGLLASAVGQRNWPLLREHVDRVVRVSEAEIARAMRTLVDTLGILVEPSAAVALAGLKCLGDRTAGPIACVLTGGNIEPRSAFAEYSRV